MKSLNRNDYNDFSSLNDNAGFNRKVDFLARSFTGTDWRITDSVKPDSYYYQKGRELGVQAEAAAFRQVKIAVSGFISKAIERVRQTHTRRTTIKDLSALTDWQLKDIGITRGQISMVVDDLLESNDTAPALMVEQVANMVNIDHSAIPAANDDSGVDSYKHCV